MKKILICVLALLLMIPFSSCTTQDVPLSTGSDTSTTAPEGTTGASDKTPEPDEKTLDIYLVAGQSNAGGSTAISSLEEIFEFAPELRNGFSNVHYAGTVPGSGEYYRTFSWKKTTYGLGKTANHFGPEAGMAKALSTYYNKETGRHAGIIKYALGGTSLLNWKTSPNWVSPTSEKTIAKSEITEATGQLYRGFLEQVEKSVSEAFEYGGYTSVRLCGLYWMQGEANREKPVEYQRAFFNFAKDVRKDLSEIMKKYTKSDNDCGASKMPIVVGTISQSYDLSSATAEQTNIKFITMQKRFEEIIENCYVVDNSGYKVSEWKNGQTVVLGSDKYHWSQADALEVGFNVGKAMLYCAGITKDDPFPDSTN